MDYFDAYLALPTSCHSCIELTQTFVVDNVRDNFDSESESEEVVDTKPTTATEPKKTTTTSSTDTTKPKTKRPKKPRRTEKPEEEESSGSVLTYVTPVLLLAATGLIVFSVYKYVWAKKNK
jgi:hypothetical protein